MTLTWQTIITAGAVLAAVLAIAAAIARLVRWVDRQKAQDKEIQAVQVAHDKDLEELREERRQELDAIKKELTLLTYGNLACLKGLQEQGCNGPVTEAIKKIEKHLNKKAHE